MFNWCIAYHKRLYSVDPVFRNFIVFWFERVAILYATFLFFPNLINLYLFMYIICDNIIVERKGGNIPQGKNL